MEDKQILLAVIDHLKKGEHVKNISEFARQLNYSPQTFANILSGNKEISKGIIAGIKSKFPFINVDFLLIGQPPIEAIPLLPIVQIHQQSAFGLHYDDKKDLNDLERTIYTQKAKVQSEDLLFEAQYNHPDLVFVKSDILYGSKVNTIENRACYYFISAEKHLHLGTATYIGKDLSILLFDDFATKEVIPQNEIMHLWKITSYTSNKVDVDQRYMGSMTPSYMKDRLIKQKQLIDDLKAKLKE